MKRRLPCSRLAEEMSAPNVTFSSQALWRFIKGPHTGAQERIWSKPSALAQAAVDLLKRHGTVRVCQNMRCADWLPLWGSAWPHDAALEAKILCYFCFCNLAKGDLFNAAQRSSWGMKLRKLPVVI